MLLMLLPSLIYRFYSPNSTKTRIWGIRTQKENGVCQFQQTPRQIQIEQNRCAMACQGCGAVLLYQ